MNCNSNTSPLINGTIGDNKCNSGCVPKEIKVSCKKMIIPKDQKIISEQGEVNSNKRVFVIPKITDNGDDLSSKMFSIVIKDSEDRTIIYELEEKDIEILDNYIKLTWVLDERATIANGKLDVEIHAMGDNFLWKTFPGQFIIADSIDIIEYEEEIPPSIIELLKGEIEILKKTKADKENAYTEINKIKDYLYEIYYNDIDYDYAKDYFQLPNADININACSSLRKGNFYGRNLDWIYNDNAEFIVKLPRYNNHYASIGVAGSISALTNDFVESKKYSDAYKILPFYLLDGINEKGVFCNTNVVPVEGEPMTHTTPTIEERDRICVIMLTRYIVDNFTSAEEAIDYIEKYVTIYAYPKLHDFGYESHYMIGDENKTFVLEIVNNQLVYKEWNIMTNFYIDGVIFNDDGKVYTPANVSEGYLPTEINNIGKFGSGLERYNLIVDGYENINDKSSMRDMMNSLLYTRTYPSCTLPEGVSDPFWYTEYVGSINGIEYTVDTLPANFESIVSHYDELYVNRTRKVGEEFTWQTVHSSVYDISERKLYIVVQEDGEELEFTFDYYYTAKEIDEKKQDKLISGENIKTINNQSILGEGNIDIEVPPQQIYRGELEPIDENTLIWIDTSIN